MTTANSLASLGSAGVSVGFKNRIINGAMVIDQRNAGASVTPTSSGYTLDRWNYVLSQASKGSIQQNAGSVAVVGATGFTNYLGFTSASAYSISSSDYFFFAQPIEGFNVADLAYGTASAKTVTLSFWVYSSLTGTFGGSLRNNGATKSYPFTYTVSSANTWTKASVTIAGDTATALGSTTNGIGLQVCFGLGVGSTSSGTAGSWQSGNYYSATGATSVVGISGATFYITGVQLEVGSSATGFEYRNYGTELLNCQRYYQRNTYENDSYQGVLYTTFNVLNSQAQGQFNLVITMRTAPSLEYSSVGAFRVNDSLGHDQTCSAIAVGNSTPSNVIVNFTKATGNMVQGNASYINREAATSPCWLAFGAEL